MRFSIQTLIWGCVVLALFIAGGLAFLPKPVEVEIAVASERPLRLSVREDGKTRIPEKYVVSAPVAGRLSRIELNAGDTVAAESTLVAVILPADPTMLDARAKKRAEAQVEQAQASLKRSQATEEQVKVNYDLNKKKYERLEKLLDRKAVSQDELEIAHADYLSHTHLMRTSKFDSEIAAFELEMARAALMQFDDSSQASAEPFEVYAPISGKILRVFQESSTVLSVGTPLIEVGDPANLEMEIDVLSTDAVRIETGAEVIVEHWGGKSPLKGRVRVVEPAAFTKISSLGVEEQRVNVIVDFDESPEQIQTLGDGYRVEANIVIEQIPKALCVPNSSLFRYQREWHLFRVNDTTASLCPVEIGLQNDEFTQVLSGVPAGSKVILYPSDDVEDGKAVLVAP